MRSKRIVGKRFNLPTIEGTRLILCAISALESTFFAFCSKIVRIFSKGVRVR